MELMTNRKWTALRMNNVRENGCSANYSLASTVFTCRSYEYQILLAKLFIIDLVFAHTIERYPYGNFTASID